jgi:DNA-directed RNA polymerase
MKDTDVITRELQLNPNVDPTLYVRQMELEREMHEEGVRRLEAATMKHQDGQEDNTAYGSYIIGHFIEDLAAYIAETVEARATGRGAGAGCVASPLIQQAGEGDYRAIAMLTLKAIVSQLTKRVTMTALCARIGMWVEDEYRCKILRGADKKLYDSMVENVKQRGVYAMRKHNSLYYTRLACDTYKEWNQTTRFKVGLMLFDCVLKSLPTFVEVVTLTEGVKTTKYVVATPDTLAFIKKHMEHVSALACVYEPMVVPPVKWTEGMVRGGGYISSHVRPLRLVKARTRAALEEVKYAKMPKVLAALNATQETAWRIRKPILELLLYAYEREIPLGGLKLRPERPLPPLTHDPENRELHRKWARASREVYEDNIELRSYKLNVWRNLVTARKYQDYGAIYFPHQLDFRGRVYPVTSISPQGEDYIKALIEFSEGKELGTQEAADWLFIHTANLFGVDKVSFADRIKWTQEHFDALVACAEAPLENRFWEEADKPWQALAVCYELKGYKEHGLSWVSRVPIALDGSCSGLQNLGMAFKCEVTGRSVNLVPSDKPSDIYQEVADKVVARLKQLCEYEAVEEGKKTLDDVFIERAQQVHDAEKPKKPLSYYLNKLASNKENEKDEFVRLLRKVQSEVTESYAWLKFGVTRKTAKRSVMTFPYGSEQYGFRQQIMEDTLIPTLKELKFKHATTRVEDIPKDEWLFTGDGFQAANVMAGLLYEAVSETVLKAAEAMRWLKACAKEVASQNNPVKWVTPLGFPVTQDYRKLKAKRIDSVLNGSRYSLTISDETLDIDKLKSANSISPNVVHSLDSSHLMLTTATAYERGIDSFALIHDSFGTHAADTSEFFRIIRECFIELYNMNVFESLAEQFQRQVPPETELPPLPTHGNLDRNTVLDSLYAFA